MPIVSSEFDTFTGKQNPFAILDDSLLKGGLRIVDTKTDLEQLNVAVVKLGMYVAVTEEQGKLYECTELEIKEDPLFGDNYIEKIVFSPVVVGATGVLLTNRKKKKVRFSEILPNQVAEMPVDLGCRSCIITYLQVSGGRKMELEIFSSKDKIDPIPYMFNSMYRYFDDGSTFLKNKTRFQYKKFYVLINNEPDPLDQRIFLFRCRSLEDDAYRTSLLPNSEDFEVIINYIPLEA